MSVLIHICAGQQPQGKKGMVFEHHAFTLQSPERISAEELTLLGKAPYPGAKFSPRTLGEAIRLHDESKSKGLHACGATIFFYDRSNVSVTAVRDGEGYKLVVHPDSTVCDGRGGSKDDGTLAHDYKALALAAYNPAQLR